MQNYNKYCITDYYLPFQASILRLEYSNPTVSVVYSPISRSWKAKNMTNKNNYLDWVHWVLFRFSGLNIIQNKIVMKIVTKMLRTGYFDEV